MVPAAVAAVADNVNFVRSPESVILHVMPVAVPPWVISATLNELTLMGSEKATEKRIGNVLVGSAWVRT